MLLKKQEKDDKVKVIYSSSNICASTFDKTNKSLTIIFNNGGQYQYNDVSDTDYMRFETADSQGVIFNSHIKKYTFEKLDKVDPKLILEEVKTLKNAEEKIKFDYTVNKMIEKMQDVVTFYKTTESIDTSLYSKLKETIAEYDTLIESK